MNAKSKVPSAAWKTWMRLLYVSATAIRSPDGEYVTDPGVLNCPGALPYVVFPITKSKVPLGWKTWMRLLYVSATAIRSPDGE